MISTCLEIKWWGGVKGRDFEGAEGDFGMIFLGGDEYGYVHCHDCYDALACIYMFQNLPNFAF